jgi:hypothetical protein
MNLFTSWRSAAAALALAGGMLAATIAPTFADDSTIDAANVPDLPPTTITLVSDAPRFIPPASLIHLSGQVSPTAHGTVVIKDGDTEIARVWAGRHGAYTFTIFPFGQGAQPLGPGTHVLTATFLGNDNFAASTSAPVTEVVRGMHW